MDEKINQPENFDYIVLYIYVLDISHRSYIHTLIFDPRNFLNSTPGLHNLRKINAFKIHKYASKKQFVSIKSGNIFLEKFKLVLQIFRSSLWLPHLRLLYSSRTSEFSREDISPQLELALFRARGSR